MWREIFAGGALWVSIYATFVLNFCDVTRSSTTRKSIIKGNFWGIPINMLSIPNTFLLVAAALALLVLTNLFPKKLNFRRASLISGRRQLPSHRLHPGARTGFRVLQVCGSGHRGHRLLPISRPQPDFP